jgi:hypothetical protein
MERAQVMLKQDSQASKIAFLFFNAPNISIFLFDGYLTTSPFYFSKYVEYGSVINWWCKKTSFTPHFNNKTTSKILNSKF